jgi:hypothetical protein
MLPYFYLGKYLRVAAQRSFTCWTLASSISFSRASSSTSITFSTPCRPSTHGTPTKYPPTPYSWSQYAAHGSTRCLSRMIDSTIAMVAAPGA